MKPVINYSHEKFISDIQHLELVKDLFSQGTDQTYKAAFYLSDQFVETIMFRILKAQTKHDSELIAIFQPQIDQDKISEINRYYDKKIKWLCKLKYLNLDEAEKIRFIHLYRNLSYHNETENTSIFPILSSLGISNAIKLFKSYYSIDASEVHFGSGAVSLLGNYSLPTDRINYRVASDVVAHTLERKLLTKQNVEAILRSDLSYRLHWISTKREQLSWLKNDVVFDIWLKTAEFFDVHPHDQFSKRVHEVNYELLKLSKGGGKIKEEDALRLSKNKKLREIARDKKIRRLLTEYKQNTSSKSIEITQKFLSAKFPTLPGLLSQYRELDKKIRGVELLIAVIEEDFDREVQREIDIRRGK